MAQPISPDGGPPAWAVDKRAELAGQVAGEMGGPQSVKVAHVYAVLRYSYRAGVFIIDHLVFLVGLHLEALPGPHDLGPRVALDLALKEGVAALRKPGVAKDLLENRRRSSAFNVKRHPSLLLIFISSRQN